MSKGYIPPEKEEVIDFGFLDEELSIEDVTPDETPAETAGKVEEPVKETPVKEPEPVEPDEP